MTRKKNIRNLLLTALILCSLSGLYFHLTMHSSNKFQVYSVSYILSIIGVFIIPVLFLFRKTVHYGYVLNGMTAIIGFITMVHYSVHFFPEPFIFMNIFNETLLAYILIAGVKFFLGKALFDLEMFGGNLNSEYKGSWLRYPNMGWWRVHFVAISTVYVTGNILWRSL